MPKKQRQRAACSSPAAGSMPHQSGIVAHVVCKEPTAHAELLELCALWHLKKNNSMYVDWEQSLSSYKASNPTVDPRPTGTGEKQ